MTRPLHSKDFLAGLLFAVFGVIAMFVARGYPIGTAMRMGPGYFPMVLGGILILFGAYLMWRGLRRPEPVSGGWGWRPLGLGSFAAYMVEKKVALDPSRFGKGAIEGVAAPEAANNAAAQTSFIPTLTLGIPGTPVMALMLGAMIMLGVTPGPQVMTEKPELFWGIVASMWIGNLMLVILNLPLVGLWVRRLRVPYRWLFPAVIIFCCIDNYSVNNNPVDVYLCAGLGVLGYVLAKLECEPAPLVLGYVLGPLLEEYLRRAMLLGRGDPSLFFTRPISLAFMAATVLLLAWMIYGTRGGRS